MNTLTNINKLRNPNYLGGWDLQDNTGKTNDIIVTIKEVKQDEVFDQKTQSMGVVLTVYFNEVKPVILNATNRKTLCKVTETEFIEQMVGKRIQLTTKRIKAFGEYHDAIRIVNKIITEQEQKPVIVDEAKCIKILEDASGTLQSLGESWAKLSNEEKANPVVLAKKEELKNKINAGI